MKRNKSRIKLFKKRIKGVLKMETIKKEKYSQVVRKTVINHFDVLSKSYDDKSTKRKNYLDAIDQLILREFEDGSKLNILDVACGTAFRTEKFKLNLNGSSVYGCDVSSGMLNQAKNRLVDGFILSDMVNLSFREKAFDAIFCLFNAFGYLSTRQERVIALKGLNGALKKNGLLFIDFMNVWHLGEDLSFRRSMLSAIKIYLKSIIPSPSFRGNMFFELPLDSRKIKGFVHGFSEREIEFLLREARFSIHKKFIVGYDSGKIKKKKTQGQFFYIVQKIDDNTS